jgi:hypothetical protein
VTEGHDVKRQSLKQSKKESKKEKEKNQSEWFCKTHWEKCLKRIL